MVLSWKENLPTELKEKVDKVDKMIEPRLEEIDEQVFYNQQRVLDLFRKHRVGEEDLVPSTGYGYDDVGRDKLEAMYADYFKTDDALVRPQFSSATHAIAVGLFSMLRPGDTLYYLSLIHILSWCILIATKAKNTQQVLYGEIIPLTFKSQL